MLYTYCYEGGKLVRMTIGDTTTMDFFYDQYGRPFAMKYNTRILYYVLNAQGDVTRLIHGNGDGYATYHYDAWGNITYATDNQFTRDNPLRYRGYVYDTDTQLYYCQSRYYDPALGRFLNADAFTSTGQGILGNNMFAYCGSNPVIRTDSEGTLFFTALGTAIGAAVGALDAWIMGGDTEDIIKGAKAGAWSGGIAGAGVDVGVLVVASGGTMGVALGVAAGAGALGGVVGTGVSTDWKADPIDYTASAIVSGGLNMVSFGLAPVNGEILKGTINQMINGIYLTSGYTTSALAENTFAGTLVAEATTWITRVITNNNQRSREH